jgi:hypothetical protein
MATSWCSNNQRATLHWPCLIPASYLAFMQVKCKSGPNGQNANQCVVQLQLVASFTGGFVPGVL